MNPVEIAALDALDLLVVVDNESDTLWMLRKQSLDEVKVAGIIRSAAAQLVARAIEMIWGIYLVVVVGSPCMVPAIPLLSSARTTTRRFSA